MDEICHIFVFLTVSLNKISIKNDTKNNFILKLRCRFKVTNKNSVFLNKNKIVV